MTWVTVQTHDIGDTFLGIYALERAVGVGGPEAICRRVQGKRRVLGVVVWSFGNQSQERIQVAKALSGGGSQGSGGSFASALLLRKSASQFLARPVALPAPSTSAVGAKEAAGCAEKKICGSEACS